jgi:CheY-like chemotaxis protein
VTNDHEVRRLIPLYAVGALEAWEAVEVEMHVEECSLCTLELSAFKEVVEGFGDPPSPPRDLFGRILVRVRASSDPATIVLVDDAPEIRLLMRFQLEGIGGFSVVAEGADGFDAVALAREHQPDFLVLDLCMPGLSGVDAIPLVRKHSPDTQIIACSAFEDMVGEAHRRGASACLTKAVVDISELGRTLQRLAVQ